MTIQPGQTVLLTGASGGLGVYMAQALADKGMKLALLAYPGTGLDDLQKEVEGRGAKAVSFVMDLRDPAQRSQVLHEIEKKCGVVDILINNAGIEHTAAYHELPEDHLREIISVNFEAPMYLARQFLPGMLERKRGHIINISSLAGRSGPAYQEPYAATKAALVAFTSSLRASYHGSGVSASVITPGFVEAGIYAHLKAVTGCSAPALLGTSPPEKVARAVLHAIEQDLFEIIVNPYPVRPMLAFNALFPSVGEWMTDKIGTNDFFRRVVEAQKRKP